MEFTSEFEALREEIAATASEISEVSGLPEELISRFLIHGIFIAGAHCKQLHGITIPIDPEALLVEALGEDAAKRMFAGLSGGESRWAAGSREEPPGVVIVGHRGTWEDKS